MSSPQKSPPNSLKMLIEPEQLELFSGSSSIPVHTTLCGNIAEVACHVYGVSALGTVHDALVHQCSAGLPTGQSFVQVVGEYLTGAATALNPLPPSTVLFGNWRSDQNALSSDWQAVQRDMSQVWRAISSAQTLVESICDERHGRQKRQSAGAAAERSDAA